MRAKSRIWAKISELVSQGFFGGCFHRQGPTIYNISTALVCEKRRAKGSFLRVQWGLTANARWRRVAQQEARTTQLRAPEQSLAARNVRRGKRRSQLVTKRIVTGSPRGQPRFSPCGRPHRAFPVTRRWVPWHPIPPCSPKKGDTRASSRDPQSILGLPSASFCF